MGKKVSANFEDKNRIKEWLAVGKTPEEVSNLLGIEEAYIAAFAATLEPASEVTEEVNEDVEYPE